jgi:hypothetical protein
VFLWGCRSEKLKLAQLLGKLSWRLPHLEPFMDVDEPVALCDDSVRGWCGSGRHSVRLRAEESTLLYLRSHTTPHTNLRINKSREA